MKRLMILIAFVVAVILAFSAGVKPLSLTSTIQGMRLAAAGKPGTFMMTDGKLVLMAWERGMEYVFVVVNTSGEPVKQFLDQACGNGNRTCYTTMSEFVKWMEGTGWKYIGPASLPPALLSGLSEAVSWLNLASSNWPTFAFAVVLPPDPDFFPQGVKQ